MALSRFAKHCYLYNQGIVIVVALLWLCCSVFGENDKVSFKEILMKPLENGMENLPNKNWIECMLLCHMQTGCKAFLLQKTMMCILYNSTDAWVSLEPGERAARVTGYTQDLVDILVPAKTQTSCSSSSHANGYPVQGVNDGNMLTSYKPYSKGSKSAGAWFQIDFDQEERVIALDMYQSPFFKQQCQFMTFTFKETTISVESTKMFTHEAYSFDRFLFPHTTTDMLRITCDSGVSWDNRWHVYEIIIYAIPRK